MLIGGASAITGATAGDIQFASTLDGGQEPTRLQALAISNSINWSVTGSS